MRVLFLGQPRNLEPWFDDVRDAIGPGHEVTLFDPHSALAPQLHNVAVVIDQGGGVGTRAVVDAAAQSGVKLWQVLGTGMDHVDVQYIVDRGLALANTPGPFSSVALAEHALFLMLYFAKNFPASQDNLRAGVFYGLMNEELEGRALGVIGLGASAQELARRASAFGMRVLGLDVEPPPAAVLRTLGVQCLGGPEALHALIRSSDYVSVHVPLTSATRHMLDARAFDQMQPHAVLINVARGAIVDETALAEALRSRKLRGAGIDVFTTEPLPSNSPLLQLDNVVLTPHVAGVTTGTSQRRAGAVAENVRRIAAGLPPVYSVWRAD
jgi:phosphoglycerate dehydrogenase-like enzyme